MADNKKGFLLYADIIHTVEHLTDEQAGRLFKHILSYVNDENPEPIDVITKITFEPIKQSLKRDLTKYEDKRKQWSEAGKRSAKARAAKKALTDSTTVEKRSTDSAVSDSVSVSVSVIDKDITKEYAPLKNSATAIWPSFDDFYNLYDKKKDAKKARPKWDKLPHETKVLIMERIPPYKLAEPNKKFRKDPVTYLNQESWNNELIIDNKNKEDEKRKQLVNAARDAAQRIRNAEQETRNNENALNGSGLHGLTN